MIELTEADYTWAVNVARKACRDRGVTFTRHIADDAKTRAFLWSLDYAPGATRASFRTYAYRRIYYGVFGSRRSWRETVSLDAEEGGRDETPLAERVPTPDGDPVDGAIARETFERLLARCEERERKILRALAAGRTTREVARAIGRSESHTRRLIMVLRQKLRG